MPDFPVLGLAIIVAAAAPCDYETDFERAMGKPLAQWQEDCRRQCRAEVDEGADYCGAVRRYLGEDYKPHPCAKCKTRPLVPWTGESALDFMKRCGGALRGMP